MKLHESLAVDTTGYQAAEQVPVSAPALGSRSLEPVYVPTIRCPLPPSYVTPDTLRSGYKGGMIPQYRIYAPQPQGNNSGNVISTTNISTTSAATATAVAITSKQASVTTSSIAPNVVFESIIQMAKSFQLLSVSASSACRIQLYGTFTAQTNDLGRSLDIPPGAGISQNLIEDLVLDTGPFTWAFQNRMGANQDTPQSATIYITITNLDVSADVITVSFTFVPLET